MKPVFLSRSGSSDSINEDACLLLSQQGLYLVADGVGGGPNGALASRTTVSSLKRLLQGDLLDDAAILDAIQSANDDVLAIANTDENRGMACTLALVWIEHKVLKCFHVGDSRIYVLRNGRVKCLTEDHVREVIKPNGSRKNLLTRAMGATAPVNIARGNFMLEQNDQILLVTDGITDVLSDSVLESILNDQSVTAVDKVQALVSQAEEAGGKDDKTVILIA